MPIYRVTFTTEMLIDAENEGEAERIGYDHLVDEVGNGISEVLTVRSITSLDQLQKFEKGSLPWRSSARRGEPEKTVGDILKGNGKGW